MSASLFITELSEVVNNDVEIVPPVATQAIDFSDLSSHASAEFNAATVYVELTASAPCCVKFGASPTAASTDSYLAAGERKLFRVGPNSSLKVAVIYNAA